MVTALPPGTDHPRRRATDRAPQRASLPKRLWIGFLRFCNQTVRMYVVGIGAVIVAVLIVAVATNVKHIDRRQREADTHDAFAAAYAADLRAYDNALRDRADCLAGVARSDLNRAQHETNRDAWLVLKDVFAGNQQVAEGVDAVIKKMNEGELLKSPPRSLDECPPIPVAPIPPESG